MNNELQKWIESRPPAVREVARKLAIHSCFKSTQNKGHYKLYAIDETDPVTVKIIHGSDSFLPGYEIFNVNPDTLEPCNCGEWRIK